jgi:CPA1 family monovalent cation:H+ antiporter
MRPLLRVLGLVRRTEQELEYERAQARLRAASAARQRLERLRDDGVLSAQAWEVLNREYRARGQVHSDELRALYDAHPELHAREIANARIQALRAERSALLDLLRQGTITDETYQNLAAEVDRRLDALRPPPREPEMAASERTEEEADHATRTAQESEPG